MKEVPEEIANLKRKRSDRSLSYRLVVEDCSDVDLSVVTVPDESVLKSLIDHVRRNEYLATLPKEVACWFIDNDMKRWSHKIMIKEMSVARMTRVTSFCGKIVAEIDELQTAEEIRSFYLDTFGIFASNRGKWVDAVNQCFL